MPPVCSWLQPESYLDPKQCDVVYSKDELKCSWPANLIVQTKDQYGQIVHVPNLKVIIKLIWRMVDILQEVRLNAYKWHDEKYL